MSILKWSLRTAVIKSNKARNFSKIWSFYYRNHHLITYKEWFLFTCILTMFSRCLNFHYANPTCAPTVRHLTHVSHVGCTWPIRKRVIDETIKLYVINLMIGVITDSNTGTCKHLLLKLFIHCYINKHQFRTDFLLKINTHKLHKHIVVLSP